MIEELILRGFQSHTKLKIKLDPHVTTVVGSSDVGKSAVIRALRWLATNKPGGDSFVKIGEGVAKVTLKIDGHEIRRTRGKGKNTYHLDGTPLKAFGSDVPDQIAKLLNVSDINFQGQHDAPFWFNESAGSVSRSLNAIIDLSVIDDTLTALLAKQREAVHAVWTSEQAVGVARLQWEDLKPVKAIGRELTEVEGYAEEASKSRAILLLLSENLRELSEWGARAKTACDSLEAGKAVVVLGETWVIKAKDRDTLSDLLTEYRKASSEVSKPIPDPTPLDTLNEAHRKLATENKSLAVLLHEANRLGAIVEQTSGMLKATEEKFKELLGERCPLCDRKI